MNASHSDTQVNRGCSRYNLWNYEMTPKRGTIAAVVVALAAIAAAAGVLAILASYNIQVGPFNAFGNLTVGGGGFFAGAGGATFLLGLSWLVSKGIQSCRSHHEPSGSSHPSTTETQRPCYASTLRRNAFDSVRLPDYYSTIVSGEGSGPDLAFPLHDREINGTNSQTLVRIGEDRKPIPANFICLDYGVEGQAGRAPYIVSAAPDSVNGEAQRQDYYQMVVESRARCLFSVIPLSDATYPHFIREEESITLDLEGGLRLSCNLNERIIIGNIDPQACDNLQTEEPELRIYAIQIEYNENLIYQIVPTFTAICSPLEISFLILSTVRRKMMEERDVPIDDAHPMIVNCHGGKDRSVGAVLLNELFPMYEKIPTQKERDEWIDEYFWDFVMELAIRAETQTVGGGGVTWANQIVADAGERWRPLDPESTLQYKWDANLDDHPEHCISLREEPEFRRFFAEYLRGLFHKYAKQPSA